MRSGQFFNGHFRIEAFTTWISDPKTVLLSCAVINIRNAVGYGLPLTKTALMAPGIFTALIAYSDMMRPLICNTNMDKMTLSAGVSSLKGLNDTRYPVLMAGATLAMIPMMVICPAFRRQFIEGIALTGLKG